MAIDKLFLTRHYKIIIKGKVQGVGYRFNAQAIAHKLDLYGYVKNQHDGSVLVHAEGEENNVNKFIEWCYSGPRRSDVTEVQAEEQDRAGFQTFEIKR